MMSKTISRKIIFLLLGFLLFVLIISLVRNLFFPIVEPIGEAAIPKWKLVIGFPTFFVPCDFSGCIIFGPRVYPVGVAINLAEYFALVGIFFMFRKRHNKSLQATAAAPSSCD
jgi:hypothetical protein